MVIIKWILYIWTIPKPSIPLSTACKLLAKLECYGVDGMLLNWIRNFLNDRIQFVKIAGMCSPTSYVISDVPQGSVLGPAVLVVVLMSLATSLREVY